MHNKRPVSPVHHGSHLYPSFTTISESGVRGTSPFRSHLAPASLCNLFRLSFSFNVRKLDALRLPLWTFFLREVHLTRCERKEKSVRCERGETAWLVGGVFERWRGREEEETLGTKFNERKSDLHSARCSLPLLHNRVRFSRARTRWCVSREERRSRMYFGYVFSFSKIVL